MSLQRYRNRLFTSVAAAALALIGTTGVASATTWYVDTLASGANTGLSWTDAFDTIPDALALAVAGDEIWVAGTSTFYTPGPARTDTFELIDGVKMYGGFLGGETSPDERNPDHRSILSGNVGSLVSFADNCFTVVTATNVGPDTLLDGFYVFAGYDDRAGGAADGAGMALFIASPVVNNCLFSACTTIGDGGAVSAAISYGALFQDCRFVRNASVGSGGAVYLHDAQVDFVQCDFEENNSVARGGAAAVDNLGDDLQDNTARFVNSRFRSNIVSPAAGSQSRGAAIFYEGSGIVPTHDLRIYGCLFSNNTGAAAVAVDRAERVEVKNCTFADNGPGVGTGGLVIRDTGAQNTMLEVWNNILYDNGVTEDQESELDVVGTVTVDSRYNDIQDLDGSLAGIGDFDEDPLFLLPDGYDQIPGNLDDDYRLSKGSPAIDRGDVLLLPLDVFDLDEDGILAEPHSLDARDRRRERTTPLEIAPAHVGVSALDVGAYEMAHILHVDRDAVLLEVPDGSDWSRAFRLFQAGLEEAELQTPEVCEIWVTGGTYKPGDAGDPNRYRASFELVDDVACYGGFVGGELYRDERDYVVNASVLSGDIGVVGDPADNIRTVVLALNTGANARLDGFRVLHGQSSELGVDGSGGNVYLSEPGITLANCRIRDGYAIENGAGVYMDGLAADTVIENCQFRDNAADVYGGAIYSEAPSLRITGGYFEANTANQIGGAVHFLNAHDNLIESTEFIDNYAGFGGALANLAATTTMTNCALFENSSNSDAGAIFNNTATLELHNCTLANNETFGGLTGGIYTVTIASTLVIRNSILWGNSDDAIFGDGDVQYSIVEGGYAGVGNLSVDPVFVDQAGGNLHLLCSPAIDAGDSTAVPATVSADLGGNTRIVDATFYGDSGVADLSGATVDMGAYEASSNHAGCPAGGYSPTPGVLNRVPRAGTTPLHP